VRGVGLVDREGEQEDGDEGGEDGDPEHVLQVAGEGEHEDDRQHRPEEGADRVERNPPLIMASEDFSYMLERVPGCYLNIGNGGADGSCEVHNPAYDFNDDALPLGAAFFTRLVERRLAPGS